MARIKITPPEHYLYTTELQVRITDINYGGHLGNDRLLALLHEARLQLLQHYGWTELAFAGTGLIMSDVAIEFKKEAFFGDRLKIQIGVAEVGKSGFELVYRLEKIAAGQTVVVAMAKTAMVCYDYQNKKLTPLPQAVRDSWHC